MDDLSQHKFFSTYKQKIRSSNVIYNGSASCIEEGECLTLNDIIKKLCASIDGVGNGPQTDELVKVSSNDTTSGYLIDKLIQGSGITLTENNDGGNETLSISLNTSYTDGLYWKLLGNTSTSAFTNFAGTTDDEAYVFRVNNQRAGIIGIATNFVNPASVATGSGGLALGHFALNYLTENVPTGDLYINTAIGPGAGRWIGALFENPAGYPNDQNTLLGWSAGHYLQTRNTFDNIGRNVMVGESAGYRAVAASNSTLLGTFAGEAGYHHRAITAVGRDSQRSITDNIGNVSVGGLSLVNATGGIRSITVTNGGSGYTTATVTISSPPWGPSPGVCWFTATAVANLDAGVVDSIDVTNAGCGYPLYTATYPNGAVISNAVTVTITGDGVGATASAVVETSDYNTSTGTDSGMGLRMGNYNCFYGYQSGGSFNVRFWDDYNTFYGTNTGVDVSIGYTTEISKAGAIGYNARVANSNTFAIGGTGADAVSVVIGGITARATLDVIGNVAVESIGLDNSETNLVVWNSTDKILEYRTVSSLGIPALNGTLNYVTLWTPNGTSLGNSIMVQGSLAGGDYLGIDDVLRGVTTTNPYLFLLRNAYAGDATANAEPMMYINSTSTSANQKYLIRATATSMPDGSRVSFGLGKIASNKNIFFWTYHQTGTSSTGNYLEEQFHSVSNISRTYASGNKTIGVAADNGYKLEVGGTVKINSTLYLDTVANDDTEPNLLTWNSVTKDVEYRTAASIIAGFVLTDGSATTANGTAVDLGGTATGNIDIDMTTAYQLSIKSGSYINFSVNDEEVYASVDGAAPGTFTEYVQSEDSIIISAQLGGHHGDLYTDASVSTGWAFLSATDASTYKTRVEALNTGAFIRGCSTGLDIDLKGIKVGLTGEVSLDTVNNDNSEGKLLTWNSVSKNVEYRDSTSIQIPMSSLTASTAGNDIDNAAFQQIWRWNSLSTTNGLLLSSNSTLAAGNSQVILRLQLSGANANSGQLTYGAQFSNSHTGTSSTNYAVYCEASSGETNVAGYFSASAGTNNYAAIFNPGWVGIGTASPTTLLHVAGQIQVGTPASVLGQLLISGNTSGTITIQPQAVAGTFNFNLPTTAGTSGYLLTSGGGGAAAMTWTDPATLGSGITFGLDNQIPFTNATTDDFDYSANFTFNGSALHVDGSAVFNDGGAAVDFRVESDGNTQMLKVDGTNNRVYFGANVYYDTNGDLFVSDRQVYYSYSSNIYGGWHSTQGGYMVSPGVGYCFTSAYNFNTIDASLQREAAGIIRAYDSGLGATGYSAFKHLYERSGSGTPESAVAAPVGSIFHRTDGGSGTSLYIKESGTGNTGWVAVSGGSSGYTVHTITNADSPYTISETSGEIIILANATGGAITVNFPTAVGNSAKYTVKKTDSSSNAITLDAAGGELIDDSTTATILYQYTRVSTINDNANWFIID